MRIILAILIGKAIGFIVRTFKIGGGSAAPGLYALKIEPKLVEKLVNQIPKNIIITGTNGKTTTARLLAHLAKNSNLKVIRNQTGSNLERGIASTLISHYPLNNYNLGIWELDEAAFNIVAQKIKPDIIVFLNVFRDQLDRYGEIDTVLKNWGKSLQKINKKTVVLINGDDTNLLKLKQDFGGDIETFGVANFKIVGENTKISKDRIKLNFEASHIKLNGLLGSTFKLSLNSKLLTFNSTLPGIYHIYDLVASLISATKLDLQSNKLSDYLASFSPAFGRMERISLQDAKKGLIFLIKNPAGATQVFETIAPNLKKSDRLLLALNDNLADGTDVSWIWDVNFEKLSLQNLSVIACGIRAEDLSLRLKYAGFNPKKIAVEPNIKKAFRASQKGLKGQLFILPTYTAMLELQGILAKSGLKKRYWEEI